VTMLFMVTGGRDYADRDYVFEWLDDVALAFKDAKSSPLTLMHGDARGVDRIAGDWAEEHNIPVKVFPANWDRDGRAAGPIRNQLMLDQNPVFVIAFPGGKGTADMIDRASRKGVIVIRVPRKETQ
jgi:SLOG family YspA-like protein